MAYNYTQEMLEASGGMSTLDGGAMSAAPTVFPTAEVAPSPVVSPEPTVGETLAQTYQRGLDVLAADPAGIRGGTTDATTGTTQDLIVGGYDEGPTYEDVYGSPVDPDAEYRRMLRLHQAEIDATNTVYDQLLNEARLEGEGRLGSQRAIAARGGILGSSFAGAQKGRVQDYNTDINRGIQAERTAAIGAILGKVRSAAQNEIRLKREARQQGAENYLDFLANSDARKEEYKNNVVAAMLSQGYDPYTADPSELDEIGKEAGFTAEDLIAAYSVAKNSTEEDSGFTLSEGQARFDAQGNVIASRPKTYAPNKGTNNSAPFSSSDTQTLLGGGWTESDLQDIADDVRTNGLPAVIENARANGATSAQIKALEDTYGTESGAGNQFLTQDYFKKLFTTEQLEQAAADAGFGDMGEGLFNLKDVDTTKYLEYLDGVIQAYREAGYTDQEILKQMQ